MRLVSVLIAVSLVFVAATAFADEKPVEKPKFITRGLLDCTNAIVVDCGAVVNGTNVGAPTNVAYYSCTSWNESGGEVVYEITLAGPDCYVVTATLSNMACDLDIFLLASCDEGDCIDYGGVSVVSPCLEPGTYYIVVDGYNGAECSYTLTVDCVVCECPGEPPVNDTCDGAIEVFDGTFIAADLSNAVGDYDPGSGGCTGYSEVGKDLTYVINLGAYEEVTATMVPTGFDAALYIVTDCGDVVNTCLVGCDNCCTGATEEVVYCSEAGGTYYIICDAYGSGNGGPFTLDVSVGTCTGPPQPCGFGSHDICAEAVVFCGDVDLTCIDTNAGVGADYDPGSGGCTGYAEVGPDVVYKITLLPGGSVTASMDPIDYFDAAIYLITDCNDPAGTCVVGDDSGNPEEITYTSDTGGVYYLICDTYGTYYTGGQFLFDLQISGGGPSAVEETTWGGVKAMYR